MPDTNHPAGKQTRQKIEQGAADGVHPQGTYLGFDYGSKRIGISTGNTESRSAMPLKTVANKSGTPNWASIDGLIEEWAPVALVTGLPVHMDGKTHAMTHQARGFARRLGCRYNLPVFTSDERLSSVTAENIIRKNRKSGAACKTQRADVDKIAATVILTLWLETHFSS